MDNGQNDPYGFIMNPEKPPKKAPLNIGGGNPMITRIIIVAAGLMLLIILFVIGFSLLNNAGKAQNQKLLEVVQTQTEILRVAEATNDKTSDSHLVDVISNTQLSVRSSLNETLAALSARGSKPKEKELAMGQNAKNDELLTTAEANSNFDETYHAILKQQLENYQQQLEGAAGGATNEEKAILASAYEQSSLLLKQLKSTE